MKPDEIEKELKEAEKELAEPVEKVKVEKEPKKLSRIEVARNIQQLK